MDIQNERILYFILMFITLCWAFHYLYKSSQRLANGNSEYPEYKGNSELLMWFDIFAIFLAVAIIADGYPGYHALGREISRDDLFITLIIPFPVYFVALHPIIKNLFKFFKDIFNEMKK